MTTTPRTFPIANIPMSMDAYNALAEVGMANEEIVSHDLLTLRTNAAEFGMERARAMLLADCSNTADHDRLAGWRDYVSALEDAV